MGGEDGHGVKQGLRWHGRGRGWLGLKCRVAKREGRLSCRPRVCAGARELG